MTKRTTTYGPCPVCAGTGFVYSGASTARDVTCHYCNGSKQVVISVTDDTAPWWPLSWTMPNQ